MAGLISQVSGWLGLADESEALPPRPVAASASEARPVTRVATMRPRRGVSEVNEIYTIEPRSYSEAPEVALERAAHAQPVHTILRDDRSRVS